MIDTHMLSLCIKIIAFNESSAGAFSCEGGGYISLKQVQTRLQNKPQLYLFRSIYIQRETINIQNDNNRDRLIPHDASYVSHSIN